MVMHISLPAGSSALSLPAAGITKGDECEVLLPRNTSMRVDSLETYPGGDEPRIVNVTVMPPASSESLAKPIPVTPPPRSTNLPRLLARSGASGMTNDDHLKAFRSMIAKSVAESPFAP